MQRVFAFVCILVAAAVYFGVDFQVNSLLNARNARSAQITHTPELPELAVGRATSLEHPPSLHPSPFATFRLT